MPSLPIAGWSSFRGAGSRIIPEITSRRSCLYTTSGRAAIGLGLENLAIGRGDRVLVPSYHCPTMVSPIVAAGAIPVFFPINEDGLPIIDHLERMELSGVKAMLAAHYFGIPRSLGHVRDFCDRRGFALIEDCAHSFFGVAGGRPVGSWGDLAIGSLTKFFPVPEGGCLVSDSRPLERAQLSGQPWVTGVRQFLNTIEVGASYGQFAPMGSLFRTAFAFKDLVRGRASARLRALRRIAADPDSGSATPPFDLEHAHRRPVAVARFIVQRANRPKIIDRRQENYRLLCALLEGTEGLSVLSPDLPETAVPYVVPIWVEDPDASYRALRLAGVPIFRWDILWPGVPEMPGDFGLEWSSHVFQLGCHQDLSDADVQFIAGAVRSIVGGAT